MIRFAKLSILALLGTCSCAVIRNPPAASSPVREARYYRTNDVGNAGLGAACDVVVGVVIRGPNLRTNRQNWAPLARLGICTAGAVIQRSVDKGYRESGGLFVISGSAVMEILRLGWKVVH